MFEPLPYLTTGHGDPLLPHLSKAILGSTRIDIAVAFVQLSGLRYLREPLLEALERDAKIRILTGDYLEATSPDALDELMGLREISSNVELRVFECRDMISFHPKVYLFEEIQNQRQNGEIIIGSSNISGSALITGVEWNIRLIRQENELRFSVISGRFDELFRHPYTAPLTREWIRQYRQRRSPAPMVDRKEEGEDLQPRPMPIQSEALLALKEARLRGERRGLVVLATGLGKTWLAGFDLVQAKAERILFVAHREEILYQAMNTFQKILPGKSCGMHAGNLRGNSADMIFASIQSIGRHSHLHEFSCDRFDYIIIDEFHHASASLYQRVLHHFSPHYMLGLTATPERSDGRDILELCDGNLVFNCDLLRGIEQEQLCPFAYYGISDVAVDYTAIPWRNGKFDEGVLEEMIVTKNRALHAYREWRGKGGRKTLSFCVSRRHADFMAEFFKECGVSCVAIHSTSEVRRKHAIEGLKQGKYEVIFSVDLFNEGLDLPGIDTVMMLRPTESSILFLQQLGRGLRKSPDKDKLIVLDFIGNHRSFLNRPRLLLGTEADATALILALKQIREGKDPHGLPLGCKINYDLHILDFFDACLHLAGERSSLLYIHFKATHGRRPTAKEMMLMGAPMSAIRKSHGNWFSFVAGMDDLTEDENNVLHKTTPLLTYLETTSMTKCFKMVLLEALLDAGGLAAPLPLEDLAMASVKIFEKRPEWKDDICAELQDFSRWRDNRSWLRYWRENPIQAYVSGKFFRIEDGKFIINYELPEEGLDILEEMIREIIIFRQTMYWQRHEGKNKKPGEDAYLVTIPRQKKIFTDVEPREQFSSYLPFYPAEIAAGSILNSGKLPEPAAWFRVEDLGRKQLTRDLFVAQITGDSMEPKIPNQSYCLFSAQIGGSKIGEIILVHLPSSLIPDSSGSYLVKKYFSEKSFDEHGDFIHTKVALHSINPNYPPIELTGEQLENFRPLARFIKVLDEPNDRHIQ